MTVVQTMRDAELYRDGTREELQGQFIDEETIDINGKTYILSRISFYDSKIFADELDAVIRHDNPFIQAVYTRYAVNCFDLVRMVNDQTRQGFKGGRASGNELDHIRFNARQFEDPDNSGTARTSWVRTISSTGSKPFFEGLTTGVELTMAEEEGMIFLAWYNPALTPLADLFQVTMNTELFDVQNLDFELFDDESGDKVIEFKGPWTLPPEQSGEINVHYYRTGDDEMRPIGLWVKRSRELRSLTDVLSSA